MAESERITLACPLCSQEHHYPLTVERSVSFGATDTAPVTMRSFVRLFTCPVTTNQFQATLTLSETALDRIEKLTIGVPVENHG